MIQRNIFLLNVPREDKNINTGSELRNDLRLFFKPLHPFHLQEIKFPDHCGFPSNKYPSEEVQNKKLISFNHREIAQGCREPG